MIGWAVYAFVCFTVLVVAAVLWGLWTDHRARRRQPTELERLEAELSARYQAMWVTLLGDLYGRVWPDGAPDWLHESSVDQELERR